MCQLEQRQKAFVFENVRGAKLPLIGGVLVNVDRLGQALGITGPFSHKRLSKKFSDAFAHPLAAQHVASGPVKGIVKTDEKVDLSELPVPTFFEDDSGPFITGAVGISRNPETGVQNVGVYRVLILGNNKISVNASTYSDLRRIYAAAESSGEAMPIALVIGTDPALLMAASSKTPETISEIDVAGALNGQPMKLVKCETSELMVPANAEIVIEARIDFSEKILQTLGEYPGLYGPETDPVAHVTAITHRKDAMFYSIMAGPNAEQVTIGTISAYTMESVIQDNLKKAFPNIKQTNVIVDPRYTGPMFQLFVQIEKTSDAEPEKIIRSVYEAGGGAFAPSRLIRRIVVVDEDVDIFDYADIEWAVWTRVADPRKVLVLSGYQSWELDRASDEEKGSVRIGIDATADIADREQLKRPVVPGAENVRLEDFLAR